VVHTLLSLRSYVYDRTNLRAFAMEPPFVMKIHRYQGKTLVAACDKDILGKSFREGELVLEIPTEFYYGKPATLEEVIEAIMTCDMALITGRNLVKALIERGYLDEHMVLWIGGQPHAQIVREVIT